MALCVGAVLAAAGLTAATTAAAQEMTKKFIMHEAPKTIGSIQFDDGQGQSRSLTGFRGKVVLLNIWATWCVPCRKEMPTLDMLQAALGGANFEVVALSIDRRPEAVRKFFAEVGIQKLGIYLDASGKASRELGVVGLPTTLLIGRKGYEIGRLIGPAEWDAPDMVEFIRCVISTDRGPASEGDSAPAATPPCRDSSVDLPASSERSNRKL